MPLSAENKRRPRQAYSENLKEYEDHLFTCRSGFRHTGTPHDWRQETLTRLQAGVLRRASRHPVVEPRPLRDPQGSRPDIKSLRTTGGNDFLVLTVENPLAALCVVTSPTNHLAQLRHASYSAVWRNARVEGLPTSRKHISATCQRSHTAGGSPSHCKETE